MVIFIQRPKAALDGLLFWTMVDMAMHGPATVNGQAMTMHSVQIQVTFIVFDR